GKDYVLDENQYVKPKPKVVSNTNSNQYIVAKGDTLYSISKKFNIAIEELKRQNNLNDNAISIGQSILIQK
ncbi:MAG TPA: LysM peptidoglycan-binding domain-containing protein, partial [Flavobacterium alvei]|nr:LysM peptidoglycan-binding domain-containing protein [Flavobacterium alvei]